MTAQLTEVPAWSFSASRVAAAPLGSVDIATVVAALLALAGVFAGAAWAAFRWRRDVERDERDRAWGRYLWAAELACDVDSGRARIGRDLLVAMYDMRSVLPPDVELARVVRTVIHNEGDDDDEPVDEQRPARPTPADG